MATTARAKVTSKGQITLPKAIRDALGLDESSTVEFTLTDGGAVMKPATGFLARYGTVKPLHRPEDWAKIRADTAKAVGRRAVERGR